ncbi:CLUMA_CG001802, isoform A [Clunio marinus]|uniref:CLUMA_CG001802, isoform A n=1 Tax=Clunio marinus TaxID=568069 RepID=A0A1J1HIY4_9DIPT|nr:CLUMA_CG001802, isoform A [Clunio marinus]
MIGNEEASRTVLYQNLKSLKALRQPLLGFTFFRSFISIAKLGGECSCFFTLSYSKLRSSLFILLNLIVSTRIAYKINQWVSFYSTSDISNKGEISQVRQAETDESDVEVQESDATSKFMSQALKCHLTFPRMFLYSKIIKMFAVYALRF